MKLWLLIFFSGISIKLFAQERPVDGIVFDKHTHDRIAKVNVLNASTGKSVYNNLKGEFTIDAREGDILIFTKLDYIADTVKLQNYASQAIYLKPASIQLRQVDVKDTVLNPQQRLAATKRDYNKVYGVLNDRDILALTPGGGVGVGIDALYNIFSKSGRNAERLRQTIQSDYYQNVIDYRYNRAFVSRVTGLKEAQLTDFMQKYRPGYYFVTTASEYEFISYIKSNYKRYLRRPKAFALPPLSDK